MVVVARADEQPDPDADADRAGDREPGAEVGEPARAVRRLLSRVGAHAVGQGRHRLHPALGTVELALRRQPEPEAGAEQRHADAGDGVRERAARPLALRPAATATAAAPTAAPHAPRPRSLTGP